MTQALATQFDDLVDEPHLKQVIQDILNLAQTHGATDAEAGVSVGQGYSLTARMRDIETLEFNRDKSLGVTVYRGKKKGTASTNDISPQAIEKTVLAALNLAQYTEEDPYSGLADKQSLAEHALDCDLYHPWSISIEDAKTLALETEELALSQDARLSNSEGASVSTSQNYFVMGNTHGFLGGYPSSKHSLSCVMVAKDQAGMQRDYQYTVARHPSDLWAAKQVGVESAQRALSRLGSRSIKTQKVPVIFRADVARSLFGHFCSGISGGALYRKSSFLLDSIGTQVFNPNITLLERPHLKRGMGSTPFDQDGVQTRERTLVNNGQVEGYILSAYSARKLKMENTGNSGGVHNLIVECLNSPELEELIAAQDKALFVTELMGQGINMVTGSYSRGAAGFWIENGQIQFPVQEVTVAGNLKDMFKGIQAVAQDMDVRGNVRTGSVLIDHMMIAGS